MDDDELFIAWCALLAWAAFVFLDELIFGSRCDE
jgi:hypothetical protein